jgi:hypothetical protein
LLIDRLEDRWMLSLVTIDPGDYGGQYRPTGQGWLSGETLLDLAPGRYAVEVGIPRFTFDVAGDGTVTSNNPDAATGAKTGVGVSTLNVRGSGEAFGVADNTRLTVLDLLFATNKMSVNGLLYYDVDADGQGDGGIDDFEKLLRTFANDVFSAINEQGKL